MILVIDSAKAGECKVQILTGRKKFVATKLYRRRPGSQIILQVIVDALKKAKIRFSDLKAIQVVTEGPSFTGVRTGVAVANTLGWTLRLPVNDLQVGKLAEAKLVPLFK